MNTPYQLFDELSDEDYAALKADIAEHGVMVPVELDEVGNILDGHHRIRAWHELKAEGIELADYPRIVRTGLTEAEKRNRVRALNILRRHLTQDQKRRVIGEQLKDAPERSNRQVASELGVSDKTVGAVRRQMEAIAEIPQLDTVTQKDGRSYPARRPAKVQTPGVFAANDAEQQAVSSAPEPVREVAARLGIGNPEKVGILTRLHKSMGSVETNGTFDEIAASGGFHYGDDFDQWCDFAAAPVEQVQRGLKSISEVHRRRAGEQRQHDKRDRAQQLPTGIYNVVYADPPWEYDNTIKQGGPASLHYRSLPLSAICALPQTIGLQLDQDAVLFLWVTNPFLRDAFQVIDAWGFQYKTNIAWVKTDLQKPGSGFYVRGRHELLFICTRGSFTPLDGRISPPIGSVLEAPVREHSRKPDSVYDIIERLYPDCKYVELFARHRRDNWDAYGDELP